MNSSARSGALTTRVDRVATVSARIGWKALTADEYQPEGFAFLSTPNIKSVNIDFTNVNYISEFRYSESPQLQLALGDVLLVKDGNTLGITNVVSKLPRPATVNGSIAVLRPFAAEPRFLRYVLDSAGTQQAIESLRGGMGVPHLFQWDINRLRLPLRTMEDQHSIADYLDTEIAHIDALIAKKRRMIELVQDKRWAVLDEQIARAEAPSVPIRRVLDSLTDGPFGSAFASADYATDGVAVVRLGNIGFAEWRAGDLVYLPLSRHAEFRQFTVVPGDLLVAALGDERNHAGRACVAPVHGPMIVKGKCFCGRVNRSRAIPKYLAMVLSSPAGAQAITVEARGSTRQMINLEILKNCRIPLPSYADQRAVVDAVEAAWSLAARTIALLTRQIDLLAERRQAVVTAAVTGELAIPGAVA